MKVKPFYLLLPFLLFSSCGDDETPPRPEDEDSEILLLCDGETTIIELPNGDNLTIPACFVHNQLPGLDSYYGEIVSEEEGITIMYDMGLMAGGYVSSIDPDRVVEQSQNEEFWYVQKEYPNSDDPDCCAYFTFPDTGPANFIISDDEHFDEVLEIMKTYKSN